MDTLIDQIDCLLSFHSKFVDDIITAVPEDNIEEVLNVFNNFDKDLTFTIEKEDANNSVPFLDTRVIRNKEGCLKLDWYQKETSSGRYIHYASQHPISTKVNFIKEMSKRIRSISDEQLITKNLRKFEIQLKNNGYPNTLIKSLLYRMANEERHTQQGEQYDVQSKENTDSKKYSTLMAIPNLTSKLVNVFRKENIQIAIKNRKTVGTVYSNLKDKIPVINRSNVVYQLNCKDCEGIYIGHTSQLLKNRMAGHKSDCKHNAERCMLAKHVQEKDHQINYNEVKILCQEPMYQKRLFHEMYHIYTQQNTMNKRTDIQNLSSIYTYVLSLNHRTNHNESLFQDAITF